MILVVYLLCVSREGIPSGQVRPSTDFRFGGGSITPPPRHALPIRGPAAPTVHGLLTDRYAHVDLCQGLESFGDVLMFPRPLGRGLIAFNPVS